MGANDLMAAESIRHSVQLSKYTNSVVRQIIAILNRADSRLFAELVAALESVDPSSFKLTRLESLLSDVRTMNAQAYDALGMTLGDDLHSFVVYEASYQAQLLTGLIPSVHVASISAEQVFAAATAQPFQGVLLKGVWSDLAATRMKKIVRTIAQGFVENRTVDELVRELRGTRAAQYSDGLLEVSRREAATVTKTAINHFAAFVANRASEANADLLRAVQWSSTLDLKTSEICRARDGLLYGPVDHEPIGHDYPWLGGPGNAHWNCRSGQIMIFKSNDELGIDVPEIVMNGTRASMDGQVPKDVTYLEWMKTLSPDEQDAVLGPTRGRLMRDGKLPPERMYGHNGQYLTLDDLRASDAAAFDRAGL